MNDLAIPRTEGEQAFVSHFNAETFNQRLDPANSWLDSHDQDWSLRGGFRRWAAIHDPEFMQKIDDEERLPPYEVPWSSREGLLFRVQELPDIYPDLQPLVPSSIKVGVSD